MQNEPVIALCGNPNVGKSTLFNALTGMKQHTGNWSGKTVSLARGICTRGGKRYGIVDLPGTYSLLAHSKEEEIASGFIADGNADAAVVVCDATCLVRSLTLAMQVSRLNARTVICINLMDEAERRGISIDTAKLEALSGLPCAAVSARSERGIDELFIKINAALEAEPSPPPAFACDCPNAAFCLSESICAKCVAVSKKADERRMKVDRILTGRYTGIPIMLMLLAVVFYITLEGANYPSAWLSRLLLSLEPPLNSALLSLGLPQGAALALSAGAYRVLAWVVSVMLPPMAIFFPMFTFLEELGYLPRAAFNMDHYFSRSGSCGKQALTMLMGLGCNAAAIVGCRIIDSPRERLIAILTNAFVPCNGRFPALIAVISMFFTYSAFASGALAGAVMLTALLIVSVAATLLCGRLLSRTLLKGEQSSFTLELPPFRMPRVGRLIVRSVVDRTLFVLGRAAAVAAPAGLLLYALSNISIGGQSILAAAVDFLDPFARIFGLDGAILIAFMLGFPANEIVLPIAIMAYTASGSLEELPALCDMRALLIANGWSIKTAVCFVLFSVMHWPCSTTLLTIKKETGSLKWTILAFLLPTLFGLAACFIVNAVFTLL
ncbi:MAG: ferrous iron transporter B [Clostridium sp.]|nr:ferrous iron transporter B [Clostridium sp.]